MCLDDDIAMPTYNGNTFRFRECLRDANRRGPVLRPYDARRALFFYFEPDAA